MKLTDYQKFLEKYKDDYLSNNAYCVLCSTRIYGF